MKTEILAQSVWLLLILVLDLGCCGPPSEETCYKARNDWEDSRAANLAKLLKKEAGLTGNEVRWPDGSKNYNDTCDPTATPDQCVAATVAIHYYNKNNKNDNPIVISDLTKALKCNITLKKCDCAEDGAEYDEGSINRCIVKGLTKGAECVHHEECKGKDKKKGNPKLNCLFSPKLMNNSGDCGDIEDIRRFCSGTKASLPSLTLTLLSAMSLFSLFIYK